MPRRPPPSALRLHPGPTPPRDAPKHVLPCIPRPAFCPGTTNPFPRPRAIVHRSRSVEKDIISSSQSNNNNSSINLALDYCPIAPVSRPHTPDSRRSSTEGQTKPTPPVLRGPWDHSATITAKLALNVEAMLTPLQPVAINYH